LRLDRCYSYSLPFSAHRARKSNNIAIPSSVPIDQFLELAETTPVLDVRSPAEFAQAHIPEAVNVPLFDDHERAEVGTLYKQVGKDAAMKRGLELVIPKLSELVRQTRKQVAGPEVLVHCWRGGLRSERFAMLLAAVGYRPILLDGGYQAFRREAHRQFAEPLRMVILSGLTGSGKTAMLHELVERGEQIIDLEGLACHRGSAFGAMGQPPQPTVEQFENDLFAGWRELDADRTVWVEDEGKSIGRVFLPQPLWDQMTLAPAIFLDVDLPARAEFLLGEYGQFDTSELAESITKIRKRMGGERCDTALAMLESNRMRELTELLLDYYDKSYYHAQEKRSRDRTELFPMNQSADHSSLDELCDLGDSLLSPLSRS
jgi:tRNA 2-selenouridine synthase